MTTILSALIGVGVPPQEANFLDGNFSNEPDFLDGLESIGRWLALKIEPNSEPPGNPWKSIFNSMESDIKAGIDIDTAYSNALRPYTPDIQISITKAVSVRLKAILDFEQQKGTKKNYKTKDYLQALKNLGYSFRLNELDDSIEVNGKPISDGLAAEIRAKMSDAGFTKSGRVEDAYTAYAYSKSYHPIKDYLNSLSWDGKPNIETLAGYITDSDGIFHLWLRKWLIGACAKVFEAEQNPMLVMDGKQRIGKSEFVKFLARPMLEYFTEGQIRPDDKDSLIRLAKYWVWEVSELGSTTRKADVEALKAFLTTRKVTVRKAYARYDLNRPALCSFIGTVNNTSGIFSDPTGSRRFLTAHILSIDYEGYEKNVDPNQVWAEAMAAYRAGEKLNLDANEAGLAENIADRYQVPDPILDLLTRYFEIDSGNKRLWTATIDILRILEDPYQGNLKGGNSRSNSMALAAALTKLGLEKAEGKNSNGQRARGYYGIQPIMTPLGPAIPPMPPGTQYPFP